MSDETKKTMAANENIEPGNVPEAERAETAEETTAAEPSRAELLQVENADLRDRLLRAAAEMENLRKRTQRESRDAAQYAISQFARDVLGVSDNMRRAMETVSVESRDAADPTLAGLLDGVEMTERELLKTLEKHGVKRLDPQGERFDPNFHQAIFEVPDESVPSGTVAQVVQTGYTIGERCLRPAMVGVSKGGPKPGRPEAASEADDSEPDSSQSDAGVDRTA